MSWIKREWTPAEAENWTLEDWLTIVISPLAYICLTLGIALTLLLQLSGVIWLVCGIVLIILMHWIIDPKLKVISEDFEKKQHEYLKQLNRSIRWEEENG